MKPQSIFVTGTDTEIGKTTVACAIARQWREMGAVVGAMKPVAAGLVDGKSEDLLALEAACGLSLPQDFSNPYRFEPPIAPSIAAVKVGTRINLDVIKNSYAQLRKSAPQVDAVIVEGAGGALVPLNESDDMLDIARVCGLPVVMVIGLRLGCINHARLTCGAVLARGLPLAGWALNQISTTLPAESDAVLAMLKRHLSGEFLGVLHWRSERLSAKL